jgi:hypothetical protein
MLSIPVPEAEFLRISISETTPTRLFRCTAWAMRAVVACYRALVLRWVMRLRCLSVS